jgi:hypothetical protein
VIFEAFDAARLWDPHARGGNPDADAQDPTRAASETTVLASWSYELDDWVHEYGFRVVGRGAELRFIRPDGRVVEVVPRGERVEAKAGVAAMTTLHVERGLEIGPRTGVTKWWGERMDYNDAVGALQDRAQASGLGARQTCRRAPSRRPTLADRLGPAARHVTSARLRTA